MAVCKGAFKMIDKTYLLSIVNSLKSNQGLLFEFNPFEDGKDVDLNIFTAEYSSNVLKKLHQIDLAGKKRGHSKDSQCNTELLTDKEFDFIELHRTEKKFHFGFEFKADYLQFLSGDNNDHFYVAGAPFKDRDGKIYFSLWLMLQKFYEKEPLISIEEIATGLDPEDKEQKNELLTNGVLYLKPCPPHWE